MNFDSLKFGVFLIAAVILVRLPFKRPAVLLPRLMLLISAAFYAFAGPFAWALFAASILLNHSMASRMQRSTGPARRLWLTLAITFNLAMLFSFKYVGGLLLPIGISFYTFEAMSVLVDVYKGTYETPRLLIFGLFLCYFPHLIAGPILRGKDLLPQLEDLAVRVLQPDWNRAFAFLSVGLFKKAVLADSLALMADPVFAAPGAFSAPKLVLAAYAFALRIFFDFSGYSDMAEGVSALFGIRLTRNFISPYGAASLTEFWRRWHVSLSGWLRDYLYIPLGGSRHGTSRAVFALFVTMALGGLWHGSNITFLGWGCFHGVLLGMERLAGWRSPPDSSWRRLLRCVVTFHLVLLGWILFRAPSFQLAREYYSGMIHGAWTWEGDTLPLAGMLVLAGIFAWWEGRWSDRAWLGEQEAALPAAGLALLNAAVLILRLGQSSVPETFIYFRF